MEASGLAPGAVDAVEQCLKALTTATKFDVAELWVSTASNFVLYHVHTDEENPIEHQTDDDDVSYARFLAKKALKSQDNFFWGSNPRESLTPSAPYRTAFAMRLPVDNVSTDLYILCYSHAYSVYSQSKLDFVFWMAHAVSVAVFSTSTLPAPPRLDGIDPAVSLWLNKKFLTHTSSEQTGVGGAAIART